MAIAILYREELREYDFGPGHPFRGDRYEIFPRFLMQKLNEDDNYRFVQAEPATDEDLLSICDRHYIETTRQYYRASHLGLSIDGSFHRYHSADNVPVGTPGKLEEAARLVIGQAKLAADLVQSDQFKKVVSLGGGMHHARRDYGEGFCIYNDVAFVATYLMEKHELERILILDTDAHAGNGTSRYFYSDPRVLFIDLHQDPRTLYPGTGFAWETGLDEGKGFTINIPMPVYAGYDSYQLAFEEIVQPVCDEFKPQIIIRNGGSDPHVSDGLTNLGLEVRGFKMIGEKAREIAQICDGNIIDLIGSGYNRKVLPYAWLALICGVADINVILDEPEPAPPWLGIDRVLMDIKVVIQDVKNTLKDYWQCLR